MHRTLDCLCCLATDPEIRELLERKSSCSGLESREYGRKDPSLWPHGTLYPQKLALTSPTSGGRSVGIVRSRTEATEFSSVQDTAWTGFLATITFLHNRVNAACNSEVLCVMVQTDSCSRLRFTIQGFKVVLFWHMIFFFHAVAWMVAALCYKPESRVFESR
jgi:hypothetical protein